MDQKNPHCLHRAQSHSQRLLPSHSEVSWESAYKKGQEKGPMPNDPLLVSPSPHSNEEGALGSHVCLLPLFPHNRGSQGTEVLQACPPPFPPRSQPTVPGKPAGGSPRVRDWLPQQERLASVFRKAFQHLKVSLAGLCDHRRWFPEQRSNH